ncbi:MAG: 4Fe-4S dicluster domain-containing protein [Oscillospiraceae bacterium]|nr:4Fe-4S dicluster domain-containing protein [Oscillospiraceae bacterium]
MSALRVRIDRKLCDGCGSCINACSEEVLAIKDGKAELIAEAFCDGFGQCLPVCPTGALSLEPRPRSCFR